MINGGNSPTTSDLLFHVSIYIYVCVCVCVGWVGWVGGGNSGVAGGIAARGQIYMGAPIGVVEMRQYQKLSKFLSGVFTHNYFLI